MTTPPALQVLVEIGDRARDGEFLDLADLLRALPSEAADRAWRILALDAVPLARPAVDLADLLHRGGYGNDGLAVSWTDLHVVAENTLSTPEALIVAPHPGRALPSAGDDLAILAACDLVLARRRAHTWTLWLPEAWLPALSATFSAVEEVRPGSTPLTSG